MKVRPFRIPKAVVLPGLMVQVRLLPIKVLGCSGLWEYDEKGQAVVSISEDLPIEVQRYTLLHELLHVVHDYIDQGLERHPKVIATKHMMGYVAPTESA